MAGNRTRHSFFLAVLSAFATVATAGDVAPLRYDLAFHMQGDTLANVDVRLSTRAGPDGIVDVAVPSRQATGVRVEHGTLDTSVPGRWIVRTAPEGNVVLARQSQLAGASRTLDWDTGQSVLVRSDALAAAGNVLFALPEGPAKRPVEVHWQAPHGWVVSTSLVQGVQDLEQVAGGTFLAARHARSATRRMGDATVTITTLDGSRDVARIARDVANVVSDATPPASRHDYTLNIVDVDGTGTGAGMVSSTIGGTAYLMAGSEDDAWMPWLIASAALPWHAPEEASLAWYTQGVAAFRILRKLYDKSHLPPPALAYMLNDATTSYGNSPLRRAPGSQVAELYANSRDMRDLVARRGELLAWLLDAHIRAVTGGRRSLEDALARMGEPTGDPGAALVDATAAIGAGDIGPLYRRYIVDGDLLQLPRDALGPCFTIGTVADWGGWQVQHVFAKPACRR